MNQTKTLRKPALFYAVLCALCLVAMPFAAGAVDAEDQKPLILKTMGSLMFSGVVTSKPNGDTFHGDHGYAQYYIPQNPRNYPLILWHGIGQSGKSFESTPDGREGFQALLPRRDWPVYIIDQPRRGRAGYTQAKPGNPDAAPTTSMESSVWDAFRNGIWTPPKAAALFSDVQFPHDPASIDQFFRQQTPDTGEEPRTKEHRTFMGEAMAELLRLTGPAVLITHSNSGQYGWATAMVAPDLVKAVVAYESGSYAFPEGEQPAEIPYKHALAHEFMQPQMVPLEEFKKLTRMPILIVYGDNIGKEPSEIFNVEIWRLSSARARQFVDAVNRHGGDAKLVFLPEIGFKGNTHAPFADLNNLEIATHLETWLRSQELDGRDNPHLGPSRRILETPTIPLRQ